MVPPATHMSDVHGIQVSRLEVEQPIRRPLIGRAGLTRLSLYCWDNKNGTEVSLYGIRAGSAGLGGW